MVQKRARRALDIPNIPLSLAAPELAVSATDDLALEAHRRRGRQARRRVHRNVTFRVTADTNHTVGVGKGAGSRCECERGTSGARVLEGHEFDGRHLIDW